ncbi:hypothetical protein CE91St56_03120 [Lachnospiraceae bacterium]|nr:hypothetical protein CE91St56_03120 [Lachnospiraceae bacterium]GKH39338.1 hypothetical protein CE91St57_03120 [Lachnospiraceae bacterium]
MALIKCPECNAEIDSEVSVCPCCAFPITTLIISKKPRNTGKLRDRDTEFTTDLLHSDRALTRCSFP